MRIRAKLFTLISIVSIMVAGQAFAQDSAVPSSGPSQADMQAAQDKASSEVSSQAKARTAQEEATMRAEFEGQFGAPPEAFQEHKPEKPKIEPPQKVSDEVKKYLKDDEILPIYCAMTKWKTGEFFSAMNSLKKNLIPAMQKAKDAVGLTAELPNIDTLISEGQTRIDSVCAAKTLSDAENLIQDFYNWGQGIDEKNIGGFMSSFQEKMKQKGDEIKQKIEAEIKPMIDEERSAAEKYFEARGKAMATKYKFTKQPSQAEIDQIRKEIEASMQGEIEQKKAEITARIKSKVEVIKDKEANKLIEIGKLFEGIDQKINADMKAGVSEYDKYKQEAFRLRKEAVFKMLDKNLTEALDKLGASEKDIEEARKMDSSIMSVSQIKSDLQNDRKALEEKLDSALEAGDENSFQQALIDFKNKWELVRTEGEKVAKQSLNKACDMALAQFGNARSQMDNNLKRLDSLRSKCSGSTSDECLKVNEFSDKFATLTSKITDLRSEMAFAENICKDPTKVGKDELMATMRKIQSDGEDLRAYGASLDAERSKIIADSADKICAQVIPQLESAKREIVTNDVLTLKNKIDSCSGKNNEECKTFNANKELFSDFNKYQTNTNIFSKKIADVESFCKNPKQENFEKISQTLNTLKEEGEDLKDIGKQLQEDAAGNKVALCKAVIPQINTAKSEISIGLKKISDTQNACSGKTDEKCANINALNSKFTEVGQRSKEIFGKITGIETTCGKSGKEPVQQDFADVLDSLKKEGDEIKKLVVDLQAEQDKTSVSGKGIRIEAESEVSSNLLPHTESWHSREEVNPSWRPAFYGTGVWYLSRGGESLTYNFKADSAGTYNVWVRDYVDNFQPVGVRRVTYSINGGNSGTYPEVVLPSSKINAQKGAFGWHKIFSAKLNAGQNTMKATKESTSSGAAIIDAFYLTTGSDVPPEK